MKSKMEETRYNDAYMSPKTPHVNWYDVLKNDSRWRSGRPFSEHSENKRIDASNSCNPATDTHATRERSANGQCDQELNEYVKEAAEYCIASPASSYSQAEKVHNFISPDEPDIMTELIAKRKALISFIHHNHFGKLCEEFFEKLADIVEFSDIQVDEVFEMLLSPCLDDCFTTQIDAACCNQKAALLFNSICDLIRRMVNLATMRGSLYRQQLDRYGSDCLLDAIKRKTEAKQSAYKSVETLTLLIDFAEDTHYIALAITSSRTDNNLFFHDSTGSDFRAIRIKLLKHLGETHLEDQNLSKQIVDEVNASLMYEKEKAVWSTARNEFKNSTLMKNLYTLASRNRYYCIWNKVASY